MLSAVSMVELYETEPPNPFPKREGGVVLTHPPAPSLQGGGVKAERGRSLLVVQRAQQNSPSLQGGGWGVGQTLSSRKRLRSRSLRVHFLTQEHQHRLNERREVVRSAAGQQTAVGDRRFVAVNGTGRAGNVAKDGGTRYAPTVERPGTD